MSGDKKRDCLRLSVCDENIERVLLAQYLRESEAGVTTKCFQAIKGFFHSIAVAECTESTKAQRDAALHLCLTSLSHQMTWLMDYHYRLDGTVVAPGSLSTVVVNGGVGWQSPPSAISTGSIASPPPSPPPAAIAQVPEPVPTASPPEAKAKSVKEMSEEERNDYFVNMSEEERTECLNALPKDERDDYLRVLPIEERNDYLRTLPRDEARAFVKSLPNNQLTIK